MSEDFKGLNAVVTGAGSGIGLAVATMLKAEGAQVFGLDLSEGTMASVATFVKCDVGNDDAVTAAFKEIAQKVQVIDIVIMQESVQLVALQIQQVKNG
jgi:NAD(P)-dependent dehydrogenase (short-subunit alcohol dehydrogenase family)